MTWNKQQGVGGRGGLINPRGASLRLGVLMRFLVSAALFLAAVLSVGAFPVNYSTGTFDVATSGRATWSAFSWKWSNRDVQQFSVTFTNGVSGEGGFTGITNVKFRLSYPESGPYFLTIDNGTISVSASALTYTLPAVLPTTNIPPPRRYYAEFFAVDASQNTRSLAKGTLQTTWSLYYNTNAAAWTPVTVVYSVTSGAVVAESDPVHTAWLPTFTAHTNAQAATNTVFRNLHTAQGNTNAAFEPRIRLGEAAYAWGDHAAAGYLTTTGGIYQSLYVGNRSMLTTNLCDMTDGVYTGSPTSVSHTGAASVVVGRLYEWGYYKIGASGTATMTLATHTLTSTGVGAKSNYFLCVATNDVVVLRLDGTGLAQCNVSNIYVKQITNGTAAVADDLYVGGDIHLGKTNSIYFPDGEYASSQSIKNWNQAITDLGNVSGRVDLAESAIGYVSNLVDLTIADLGSVSNQLDLTISDLGSVSGKVDWVADGLGSVSNQLDLTVSDLGSVSGKVDWVADGLGFTSNQLDLTISDLGSVSGKVDWVADGLGSVSSKVDWVAGGLGYVSGVVDSVSGQVDWVIDSLGAVSGKTDWVADSLGSVSNQLDLTISDLGSVSSKVDWVADGLGSVSSKVDWVADGLGSVSNQLDLTISDLGAVSGKVDWVADGLGYASNLVVGVVSDIGYVSNLLDGAVSDLGYVSNHLDNAYTGITNEYARATNAEALLGLDVVNISNRVVNAEGAIVTNAGNILTNTVDIAVNAGNIATNAANNDNVSNRFVVVETNYLPLTGGTMSGAMTNEQAIYAGDGVFTNLLTLRGNPVLTNELETLFTQSVANLITQDTTQEWTTAYLWGNWGTNFGVTDSTIYRGDRGDYVSGIVAGVVGDLGYVSGRTDTAYGWAQTNYLPLGGAAWNAQAKDITNFTKLLFDSGIEINQTDPPKWAYAYGWALTNYLTAADGTYISNLLDGAVGDVAYVSNLLDGAVGDLVSVSNQAAAAYGWTGTNYLPLAGGSMAGNIDLAGVTISNGSFVGDGTGLTNVSAEVAYGVASDTAYRGDWGDNVSGRVATVEGWGNWSTNIGLTAGTIYDGGQGAAASNIANWASNAAVNVSNAVQPVAFTVQLTANFGLSNATVYTVPWNDEKYDSGDDYTAGVFTCPANGIYNFSTGIRWSRLTGTGNRVFARIMASGTAMRQEYIFRQEEVDNAGCGVMETGWRYYTNGAEISVQAFGDSGVTNYILNGDYSWFSGAMLRALP